MSPRPLRCVACVSFVMLTLSCVAADVSTRGVTYSPSSALPRVAGYARPAPAVGRIIDYAWLDGRLYLLDARGAVVVLAQEGDGWRREREFGRPGEGPGEFRHPASISATADGIMVAEPTRMQFFDRSGTLLHMRPVPQVCSMLRPSVVLAAEGAYLYGDCFVLGVRSDSVVAVLAFAADTSSFEIVAREVRYTRDGRVGNVFNMAPAFSPGSSGHHLFGVGTRNCVWRVAAADARQVAEHCPSVTTRYRSDPPDRLRARLQRASVVRMQWPDPLPPYMERVALESGDLLVRSYSADSVVLQLAAPNGRDIAVGSFEELVRCREWGCLWIHELADASRIAYLDAALLERLAAAAR